MAYLKPPAFTSRIFNPLAMRFGIGGAATLTVAGRRSGRPRSVPVIGTEHEGAMYVVSDRGESEWVRNLRAAARGELRVKGETRSYRATELPVDARAPVIAAHRQKAGSFVDRYFKQLPHDADHPVFRLDPV